MKKFILIFGCLFFLSGCGVHHDYQVRYFGNPITITYAHPSASFNRELSQMTANYETTLTSDLKRINNAQVREPITVSPITYQLLVISQKAYVDTDYKFNIVYVT